MIPLDLFESIVLDAMRELEAAFPDAFDNVAVCVESRPGRRSRAAVGLTRHETLLGLYEGTPRSERTFTEEWMLPDKITLYLEPIVEEAEEDGREVKDVVREVVWHEVAHALGLEEDRARAAEGRCRRR